MKTKIFVKHFEFFIIISLYSGLFSKEPLFFAKKPATAFISWSSFNRASTHETKVEGNSKTTEFNDTWLVRPTHGWGWPAQIFLVWGQPIWAGQPRPLLILLVNAKIYVVAPNPKSSGMVNLGHHSKSLDP